MGKRLFVGNLPWKVTDADLEDLFKESGNVVSTKVITDRDTGRSRGFAFVEMESEEEAEKAINSLNNTDLNGRAIRVSEAQERSRR
jgi:RNA recognition motif-containing protein